eukprot:CAMPEP_0168624822 /NCGR_PEP_ID=MMETSP0449_2-20121227/9643_1 /TAXON_ID=1082188 /ORGANISM="Strombidium rassoulzadegani, Strain ras09" /LENGTH=44 /DNA_ID= /DNA_START= /DNA_END= /DNA_ORIENTATION=
MLVKKKGKKKSKKDAEAEDEDKALFPSLVQGIFNPCINNKSKTL